MKNQYSNKSLKAFLIVSFIFLCVFSMTFLSSCKLLKWLSEEHWLTVSQKEVTNKAMGRLCNAIERKDTAAVKAEFSEYDTSELENFDASIQKLFEYVTGDNIRYSFVSTGSESAAMGGYPRERTFGGVCYNITTSTDEYKVNLGYRSYYSERGDEVVSERIGITYFDIINVKNDRECNDRLYSGCPFGYKGINFDYKTIYIFTPEEYGLDYAFSEYTSVVEPMIISSESALEDFRNLHANDFAFETREDGKGFKDVTSKYTADFFETKSLYIVGEYEEEGGYMYVPQFVYIDDIVYVDIAKFPYEERHGDENVMYFEKGVLIIIELPEKVSNDTKALVNVYNPYDRTSE